MFAAWLGITLILLSIIAVVVAWAVKNKQFTDQQRAAHLPLDDLEVSNEKKGDK